ncbi:MAG: DUF1631 family protein [Gammaproteobacteria bacterium]|nr:DUF1631 family protein [Gammaproteobacteria bacterium]
MNEENRRQHPRSEADHQATLLYHGTTLSDCRIRNFSKGGLYLENSGCDFHTLVTTTVPKPGGPDIKHALIEIPRERGAGEPFTIAVRLTYVSETGIGVAYLQQNPKLFQYFQSLYEKTSGDHELVEALTEGVNHSSEQIELVFDRIVNTCQRFLNKHMPAFFAECEKRLPEEAEMAPVDALRTDLYYAQTVLREQESAIISSQSTQLTARFNQLSEHTGPPEPNSSQASISQELDLVDKDDFEEWVVIVGLGRSVEAEIPALLHVVEMGLTCLIKRAISSDTNPVSPAFLLWTLSNSLANLNIELPVKRIIYGIFKEVVLSQIEELYAELSDIFERHDIDTNVVSIKAKSPKSKYANPHAKPARRSRERSVMGTLSSIISSDRDNKESKNRLIHDRRAATSNEIIDSLNSLHRISERPITELIEQSLARKGGKYGAVKLNRESRETISATEQLLSALKQDSRLSQSLQHLVRGLEIPVIREVLENPSLLDDANHPARKLLESIDKLAPYANSAETEEPLLQIIEQIGNAPAEQSQDQLIDATQKIETLLSQKREAFDQNLSLVVQSSRQNELLEKARQNIEQQLGARLENRSLSIVIERLLQLGWPGLLIQSSISKNDSENKTKAYFGALDFLVKLFAEEREPAPLTATKLNSLTAILRKGFADYPVHSDKAQQLIKELESSLTEGGEEWRNLIGQRVVIDRRYIRECIDKQAPAANDRAEESIPEGEWGGLIRTIRDHDWIVQKREHGQVRLINLAWRNTANTRFVFVDGSGNKALDTSAAELASHFESGRFSLLESRDLPMVERAVERMLKNTFARISSESRIDELTGLLNRKAFSKKIQDLLSRSLSDGSHHALILVDIDQFSMVNDVCGYEGGDQLLKSVTRIITTYQQNNAVVARTGDDEFAILLEGTTVERGFQVAEAQRQALEAFKFSWEQQSVPISVSIGIVAVDNTGNSAQSLLKAASSACNLAKNSGRNCCRVFQLSDEEFQQQNQLIKSVPVIEEALEKNRISLHGQLITPLFLGEGSDHYEVLLRLLDKNNRPSDPTEFIRAAEKYERMRSVDRWIIDSFFAWAKQYSSQIAGIEGFTLNLSGQSLMDASFRAYIIQYLHDGALPPAKLGFEITETAVVKNISQVNSFMHEIRQLGCRFYLDDFGSGYASYSYLKDLSVDCVKIDGIFVKDMLKEKSSHAMVRSITEIAHYMNKKVIAEYVESEALIIELREIGVDYAQGYAVGLPQPLSTILKTAAAYA